VTVLTATLSLYSLGGHENIGYWPEFDGFDTDTYYDEACYLALPSLTDSATFVMPSANGEATTATINNSFRDDFYDRIHISPDPLDMGNLLSDQQRSIYVWNAYTTPQLLSVYSEIDAYGIEVTEPSAAPTTFGAFEERDYIVNVLTSGPPTILASLNFTFPDGLHSVAITGTRVVLWKWLPDGEYTEKLEFYTHILKTRQGEQRIAMREAPRQILTHSFTKTERELSVIKATAKNWIARLWGCPIWGEQSTVTLTALDTSIEFDTSNADYRNGGLLVLWESFEKVTAVEIDTVRTDGIDLTYPLVDGWGNALVMPLRLARMTDGLDISRRGAGISHLSATFNITDNIDLSSSAYPQYQGYDVFTDENVLLGDLSERIVVPAQEFDNGSGPVVVETLQEFTDFSQSLGRVLHGQSEIWAMREWLHSRNGKQKAFYLPTWNNDFELYQAISEFDTVIMIKKTGDSLFSEVPFDIMLQLTDGTIFYRRVSSVVESASYETLSIDSAVGIVAVAAVKMFCKLNLCRFNADSIELKHTSNIYAKTTIPIIEVPE